LSGIFPLLYYRHDFVAAVPQLETQIVQSPWTVVVAYLLMLVITIGHELAHGVVCKHFGGQVHNMGIMWYLGMFIFYCDTSAAWNFRQKNRRILVSLAGPLITWTSLGIVAWLAAASRNSSWLVVWALLAVIKGFSLVMNFNPLIKMDAYYMLMDWTGIPDLQRKSWQYLKNRLWGRVPPAVGNPKIRRERRFFLLYGLLSGLMSLAFLVYPLILYLKRLTEWRESPGTLLLTVLLLIILLGRIGQRAFTHMYAASHQQHRLS
jgi:putative peptide zinc metalloprotease protein